MLRCMCLALGVVIGLGLGGAAGAVEFGRYHALVIGNNAYQHLTPLETAVRDANAVAAVLRERYGFEVTVLTDANRYEMVSALDQYRRTLTPNDNLLVYYAGHGILDEVTDTGYWLPVDAETDGSANWVSNSTITDALEAIAARHVMVVADSCYSGSLTRTAEVDFGDAGDRAAWLDRMALKRSRTVLASGGLEPVADGGGGDHSVFAREFIEVLAGTNDILDGQSLYDRLKHQVVVNADQTPRYDNIRKAGHDGGDFLFVPLTVNLTVNLGGEGGAAGAAASDDAVFWQSIQGSDDPRVFEAYLAQFPNGKFRALAALKLDALAGAPSAAPAPEATPQAAPGTVFRDCAECPEMVVLPAGTFAMGSARGEDERLPNEGPVRQVTIAAPLAIGKYEVTRAEFARFVAETGHDAMAGCWYWQLIFIFDTARSWRNPGYEQGDDHPVACVNWHDAEAYAAWLSEKTGKAYRLPSEAEWEYAARAGSRTPRYWGDDPNEACRYENVYDRAGAETHTFPWAHVECDDGHAFSAPVGRFAPNPFGLHDMLGNAPEWVMDCYHDAYDVASTDATPIIDAPCDTRVLRGGTWANWPAIARAANRLADEPYERSDIYGFRVVRVMD